MGFYKDAHNKYSGALRSVTQTNQAFISGDPPVDIIYNTGEGGKAWHYPHPSHPN